VAIEYAEGDKGVSEEDVVLEGEDGLEDDEELLPLRLWMGTYNLGDDEGEEDAEWLTLIAIGADIIMY